MGINFSNNGSATSKNQNHSKKKSSLKHLQFRVLSGIKEPECQSDNRNESLTLNEKEIKILKLTWTIIQEDIQKLGFLVFMTTFEALPDLKDKFEIFEKTDNRNLIESHIFRTHATKVMKIMDDFVQNIDNSGDKLKNDLIKLGSYHYVYGIRDDFFYLMGNQFLTCLRPILVRELNNISALGGCAMAECFEEFPYIDGSFIVKNDNKSDDDETIADTNHFVITELEKLTIEIPLFDEKLKFIEKVWGKAFSIIENYMIIGMNESKLSKKPI